MLRYGVQADFHPAPANQALFFSVSICPVNRDSGNHRLRHPFISLYTNRNGAALGIDRQRDGSSQRSGDRIAI